MHGISMKIVTKELCCDISIVATATDVRSTVHSEIDIYIGSACNWPNFLALQLIVSGKMETFSVECRLNPNESSNKVDTAHKQHNLNICFLTGY